MGRGTRTRGGLTLPALAPTRRKPSPVRARALALTLDEARAELAAALLTGRARTLGGLARRTGIPLVVVVRLVELAKAKRGEVA